MFTRLFSRSLQTLIQNPVTQFKVEMFLREVVDISIGSGKICLGVWALSAINNQFDRIFVGQKENNSQDNNPPKMKP